RIGTVAVSVLEAEPPRFSPDEAAELAGRLFGVTGTATPLGSERDQAFLIDAGDDGGSVLKISNSGEDPAVLDLEDEAILQLARVLDRYDSFVLPRWPRLRAQVVHGDFNLDHVLLDERGRVSGIVDFGDIAHSAHVGDFAVGLASLLRGRPEGYLFRVARIAVDGYASV